MVVWAALLLPFVSQAPLFEQTTLGSIIRYLTIGLVVVFATLRAKSIRRNLTGFEGVLIAYLYIIGMISFFAGVGEGFSGDPIALAKFFVLQPLIYLLALSLNRIEDVDRFFCLYYRLCLFASVQGILALLFEYMGIRAFLDFPLFVNDDGVAYNLSWFGLLGTDVGNGRTNFFFSEATHFAHFLFPGVAYALAKKKYVSTAVLLGGFASTFTGAASMAMAGFLIFWTLRHLELKMALWFLCIGVPGVWMLGNYANMDQDFFVRLMVRDTSIGDKLLTLDYAITELLNKPIGVGVFNTADHYGQALNTSSGLFRWIIWFGFLGLPFWLITFSSLMIMNFKAQSVHEVATYSLMTVFMIGATISHGPLPKYYMIFILGVIFRYHRLCSGRFNHRLSGS